MSEVQLEQGFQSRDILYWPPRGLSSSLPDHVSADFFMRDHFLAISRRNSMSLSSSKMAIDGERTIIMYDIDNREEEQQRNDKELDCHLSNRKSRVSGAEVETSCTSNELSPSLGVIESESRAFFTREMSEYLMINTEEGEDKRTVCNAGGQINSQSLSYGDFSDGTSQSMQNDFDQARVSLSAWMSTASVEDSQTYRSSSENKFKVHCYEITTSLSRTDMCQGISQTTPTAADNVKLTSFELCGAKITCHVHYLGLDQDCRPNGSITLTAIIELPRTANSQNSPFSHQKCTARLTVSVYDGAIKDTRLINEPSTSCRELDDGDQIRRTVHMTVHDVVQQEAIIYSKRRAERIFFKIKTEICT